MNPPLPTAPKTGVPAAERFPGSAPARFLTRLADAWIGAGWHTMLAAAGLAADAGLRFGFPARETIAFAALNGGGALALYGGRYVLRMISGGDGDRENAIRRVPAFAGFSCLAGLAVCVAGALALPAVFWLWETLCGIAALAYCYPLLGRPWREYGALKPVLLALCWTAVTCGPPGPAGYATVVAARAVWLTGLALAFDIKDIDKDRAQGVLTPAVRRGEQGIWPLVLALLAAGLLAKLAVVPAALRGPTSIAWAVSLLMLAKIRRSRSTRDWVVWGDGMMIVYALVPVAAWILAGG